MAAVKKEKKSYSEKTLFQLADLFKIFGDSTRIKILFALTSGEKNVGELVDALAITQPAVSQQLRVLKLNGLIKNRREGKSILYSLDDDHVEKILIIGMEHTLEKNGKE